MEHYDYLIIGASRAGMTAAETLREQRHDATILVINGEDRLPYKRTGLTKKLACGFEREEFALRPAEWYGANRIDRADSSAVSLDRMMKRVVLESGKVFSAERILVATGAVPRLLDIPGGDMICHLRRADETERIRKKLAEGDRVLVIGQGVEGVEMAEQLTLFGMAVTSISSSSRLMERWLDPFLSGRLADLLGSHGVKLFYNRPALGLSHGQRYVLSTDSPEGREEWEADLVFSSVGVKADTALLRKGGGSEGLGPGGVKCDSHLETIWKDIYAAGDVVEVPPGWATGLWHSAEHQGRIAALNMAGIPTDWTNLPVRLKCEVFGDFYFSMAYDGIREAGDREEEILIQDENRYLKVFHRDRRLSGALMQGMKPFAKTLSRLVAEGRSREELLRALE